MTPRQAIIARIAEIVADRYPTEVLHTYHAAEVANEIGTPGVIRDARFITDAHKAAQQLRLNRIITNRPTI